MPEHSDPDHRSRWNHAPPKLNEKTECCSERRIEVSLLTGGQDRSYALGLTSALVSEGVFLDFIGSDDLDSRELHGTPQVNFLNLRGDQSSAASLARKVVRISTYYARLIRYALIAKPKIFHVLWNGRLQLFDRTLLTLFYKLLGKRIVVTAHNVNAGQRDSNDTWLNCLSLKLQYRLSDHIFVHTKKMKSELTSEFSVKEARVSVIPFGINNTVPNTNLSTAEAKGLLGISPTERTMLFFGRIAPYKGLEYLIDAFGEIAAKDRSYRLVIAGKPKSCDDYWSGVQQAITRSGARERIIEKIEYIPDEQTEWYFKAADVLVLPYAHIFQTGVLFLGYNFGLPVIAADVGSLRDDIVEGKTGYIFRPKDPVDMTRAIREYFDSDLYQRLEFHRREIRDYANQRYSWKTVGEITRLVYASLCKH